MYTIDLMLHRVKYFTVGEDTLSILGLSHISIGLSNSIL